MKKFYKILKINNYTYLFFIVCALCGYLKNISIIFLICFIHELGHVLFIKLFKYDIISIEILPFGGNTIVNKKVNSSINKDLIINFGGIIFQLVFILFSYLFKDNFNIITYNLFIKYNLILILFNLIPIIPLDGNNIIHLLFEKYFSYKSSYKLNFLISSIFLIVFMYINYAYKIDNYFIISFLFYKSIIYIKNFKYLNNRFLLERYLYKFNYKKIINNTKSINDLKKEALHYFKDKNKYVNENKKIENFIFKNTK